MKSITKIKLTNFKRYIQFEEIFDDQINLLIGDNEAGKSSILTAIDIVLSGSRKKVESIGLDYLFNTKVVSAFLNSDKKYSDLPVLKIEIFLNEQNNEETNGKINSDKKELDGLTMVCEPNADYSSDIKRILQEENCIFPFEYYSINFKTFADQSYSSYKKHIKHILIDNSQVSSEYAMREYIKDIYNSSVTTSLEKYKHQHEYRSHKENFKNYSFKELNERLGKYKFAIKSNSKSNLEADLTIFEGDISIDNKGKGKQCFIKTELALSRKSNDLELVLLEEPENHLSHANVRLLIQSIRRTNDKQIFIATHSDMISTRLDLRKSILLNSTSICSTRLESLPEDTAKFFVKAPDNNILEFILSSKVILVEGDAEYLLLTAFFEKSFGESIDEYGVHVISVGGTSFKRYLDIATILNIKTAVIRDNDKNYERNCVENYADYSKPNISIFFDTDNTRNTFEVCLFQDNTEACEKLFGANRKSLSALEYMLKNKAEAAFKLLDIASSLVVPAYINNALTWIKN
ncbi:ATP-dependent nuclease [Dyadobacter sp.]|uniref:ATP-dependent nuclease n=1 Tax=Dyadobacter sp. TaxID=1914288 RepID=UPI003F718BA8